MNAGERDAHAGDLRIISKGSLLPRQFAEVQSIAYIRLIMAGRKPFPLHGDK